MDELFSPANIAALAVVVSGAVSFGLGYMASRKRVEFVYMVPPALKRLAAVYGITEDRPEGHSYGKELHDLFEAKDQQIRALQSQLASRTSNGGTWFTQRQYPKRYRSDLRTGDPVYLFRDNTVGHHVPGLQQAPIGVVAVRSNYDRDTVWVQVTT